MAHFAPVSKFRTIGAIVVMSSLYAAHTWLVLATVAKLASGASEVSEAVSSDAISGVITLSTCNRVELYAETGANNVEQASTEILQSIADATGLSYDTVASAFQLYRHDAAVRHLFEVGSGLKSAVVGERQCAGQVRRALIETREASRTHAGVSRLF